MGTNQHSTKTGKKRMARWQEKKTRLATKVKDPKTFEQKCKSIDGKILTYTPHLAWVQTFGKQPKLFKNIGAAFVSSPLKRSLQTLSAP